MLNERRRGSRVASPQRKCVRAGLGPENHRDSPDSPSLGAMHSMSAAVLSGRSLQSWQQRHVGYYLGVNAAAGNIPGRVKSPWVSCVSTETSIPREIGTKLVSLQNTMSHCESLLHQSPRPRNMQDAQFFPCSYVYTIRANILLAETSGWSYYHTPRKVRSTKPR